MKMKMEKEGNQGEIRKGEKRRKREGGKVKLKVNFEIYIVDCKAFLLRCFNPAALPEGT